MSKKRLLIIGAGIEQVRAYELAHEMDLETVGSDISPEAPALVYADHKIIASTRNVEETVSAAKRFHRKYHIDGVMTLANDVPLTVAKVAAELDLPGISIESALISSDKLTMKEKFREDGIPVSPHQEIFSPDDIDRLAIKWGFPLVIKPSDGRGARGVLRVTEDVDRKWALQHALDNSDSKKIMVEKFIEGKQLSTESMIYCNRCFTASISDRNYELIEKYAPNIIENGGVLPADLSDETLQSVADVVGRAARSLGIINGSVKGDIVLSAQGPVVIEMAARLSGGYLCTDQIPLARGVDLVKQVIKLALGEELDISELNPIDVCKMGIRYFFPEPGRIVKIQGFDELDQYEWVSKKMLFLKEGDIVEFPSNHTKRAGFVHVTAETFEDAEERAVFAANSVNFETVPV